MKKSINDRINPRGINPHNPVLRWEPGNAIETICVESALYDGPDGWEELDYSDPFAVWGDSGEPDMLDTPISDEDWATELNVVGIR